MEEQRKKRKDTDQDDGPEEEEVILFTLVKTIVLRLCLWLGSHKRESGETVRITGKCKARSKERLKKEIALCKDFNKCFVEFCTCFCIQSFEAFSMNLIKKPDLQSMVNRLSIFDLSILSCIKYPSNMYDYDQ